MKKTIIIQIAFLVLPFFLYGQSFTFHADTLNFYGQPGEQFDQFVDIHNISGQNLNLNVIRTQNDLPNGNWQSSLCVGILCFAPFVDTVNAAQVFGPLPPDSILDFHLQVHSDSTDPGTATITVKVEDQGNLSDTVALTFTFTTEASGIDDRDLPYMKTFQLSQNYPNPFNPSTHIPFEIGGAKPVNVQLNVYNILGQKVAVLLNKQLLPGNYEVKWDALDKLGNKVPAGIYFYELLAGDYRQVHKMLLVK